MSMLCDFRKKLDAIKKGAKDLASDAKKAVNDKIKEAEKKANKFVDEKTKVLKDAKEAIKKKVNQKAKAAAIAANNAKKQDVDAKTSNKHDTQDSKKDINWKPMDHIEGEPKYGQVKPMNPASYSNSQDYPNKKGHIDENKNFEIHNHTTGEWWRVHHSGYLQKVDGKGNYEEKIPGTAFYYTFGDVAQSYHKNLNTSVLENYHRHIYMEQTIDVDADAYFNVGQNCFKTVMVTDTEIIGLSKLLKAGLNITVDAGGNIKINAGGNIDIIAGGTITINGAKVNIN